MTSHPPASVPPSSGPHDASASRGGVRLPLKVLFLDIDDTLYSTSAFAKMAREAAVRMMIRAGLKMQRDDVMRELEEVIGEFTSNHSKHFDKLLSRIPEHYYEGINPAILIAAAVVGYHETKHRHLSAFEDVIDVLKILRRETDLTIGIITAGWTIKQAEKLWRLGVYEYLDPGAIFISDQIGVSKPNIKLYQRACREMGVRPPEAMYVGDNQLHDIDPPNAIGMTTVLCKRSGPHWQEMGKTKPDYEIQNFWDLLEILQQDYGLGADVA